MVALHDLVELVLLRSVLGRRTWLEVCGLPLLLGLLAWHQYAALHGLALLAAIIIAFLSCVVSLFAAFAAGRVQRLAATFQGIPVVEEELKQHLDGAELLADFDSRGGSRGAPTLLRLKQLSELLVQYFDLLRLIIHH